MLFLFSTIMSRKTSINTDPKTIADVRKSLEQYLNGVKYDLSLSALGTTVYVTLIYYDFKPRRIVRNEIENIAPNIEVDDIRREYSDHAIVEAYYEDIDDPQIVYVRLPNGDLASTCLHTLLVERMSHRTYRDQSQ